MIRHLLALTLLGFHFVPSPVLADAPIVIEVNTEEQRIPIALSIKGNGQWSASYLHEIEKVLRFDLNHNGSTICLDGLSHPSSHQLSLKLSEKDALFTLVSKSAGRQWSFPKILLSGELSKDRHQLHLVADAVHLAITGLPGIAASRILYTVRDPAHWSSEIWECDYDGFNAKQLLKGAGFCVTPSYLPPSEGCIANEFFYVSYKKGLPKIYLSGQSSPISSMAGNQLMPTLNRQRTLIAFISDVAGNSDLFLQRFSMDLGPTGLPVLAYAAGKASQGSPTFSPDGKRLAFVSNKDGCPRIYLIDLPHTLQLYPVRLAKLITCRSRENSSPCWSPDGSRIAYSAMTDGVRQIWIYDLEQEREWQLTFGPENKENPSWAPNNRAIVYNTNSGDIGELYLVMIARPEPVKITAGSGKKRFPSWQPSYRRCD